MIVRHHYDEKRRRVLNTLDHEIDVEQKGLADARDEAIRRLEKFVETYSDQPRLSAARRPAEPGKPQPLSPCR